MSVTAETSLGRILLRDGWRVPIASLSAEESIKLHQQIELALRDISRADAKARTVLLVGGPAHGLLTQKEDATPVVRVATLSPPPTIARWIEESTLLFDPATDSAREHLYWEMPDPRGTSTLIKLYEHEALRETRLTGGDPQEADYRVVEQRQAYEESVTTLERDLKFRRAEVTTQRVAKEHAARELAEVKAALERAENFIDALTTHRDDLEARLRYG